MSKSKQNPQPQNNSTLEEIRKTRLEKVEQIKELGLEILLKQVPFVNLMITASSNIALFQLVGFTACKYYEAKVNNKENPLSSDKEYLQVEQQSTAYLTEILSEKDNLNQIFDHVLAIKQEVMI